MDMWAAKEIRQGSKKLVSVREPTAKQTAGAGERERERARRGGKKSVQRGRTCAYLSPRSEQAGTEVWQPYKVNILLWLVRSN